MANKTLTIGSDLEIARDVVASAESLSRGDLIREIFKFDGAHYYEKQGNITVTKEVTIDAARVDSVLTMIGHVLGTRNKEREKDV